ncbi:MAG: DNA-directed RNA polymerase subunit omega [Acidimicrobiales bacterium]
MAQRRSTLMDPPVEALLDKVDSKFTLVALSAKRARQINSYYNSLGEGIGIVVPPQVTSVSGKPLTISFEEIAAGKATYHRPEPGEDGFEGEEGAEGAAEAVLAEAVLAEAVLAEAVLAEAVLAEVATEAVLAEVVEEAKAGADTVADAQSDEAVADAPEPGA